MTTVLCADELLDTEMPGPDGGEIATVPAMRVGELLVYPRPVIRHGGDDTPIALVLDLRRWLISLPGQLCVPIECSSMQAAIETAEAFRSDSESGAIGNYSPAALAKWAAWWCAGRTNVAELHLGGIAR